MTKSGYEFRLVDEGTMDTVIAVSGSDVRYAYSQEYRNAFDTFDEFWAWVVNDIEEDIAENGLEEDLEDM
jgi:hypothetical protein